MLEYIREQRKNYPISPTINIVPVDTENTLTTTAASTINVELGTTISITTSATTTTALTTSPSTLASTSTTTSDTPDTTKPSQTRTEVLLAWEMRITLLLIQPLWK